MEDLSSTKERFLIDEVSTFSNLLKAFNSCSKGKRQKEGYRKFLFNYGEKLKGIEWEIKRTQNFKWGGYRQFQVHDPKKRTVMAAPFRDRIVHTALYKVIDPIIDPGLGCRTFACRIGMGNRNAACRLQKQLSLMDKNRYCVKLDVKKYFASIDHAILYSEIKQRLPDKSLEKILLSLLDSHTVNEKEKRGIPIGNLTSQLFANFYLSKIDRKACELLDIDFFEDKYETNAGYIRYMDDMAILAKNKKIALEVATELVDYAKKIKLNIPSNKYVVLGNAPIPFLGYVLDKGGYRVLRRNERKYVKKLKTLSGRNYGLAYRAQVAQSYEAWQKLY